jgi:hypothetical protein
MSAICGHHSLLDNLAILFDKSNVAIVAPKFVFVVAIDEFVLVQEFFATIGTNEVFDVHFQSSSLFVNTFFHFYDGNIIKSKLAVKHATATAFVSLNNVDVSFELTFMGI